MKQILPFKKELLFKTKVSEITSISLEHNLSLKNDDLISGEFIISGDYKMTEGSINREQFQFKLPFDIALDSRYVIDSLIIDIDNFYYEIVNNEALQVNIDVYVEGEKVEEVPLVKEIPIIVREDIKEDKLQEEKSEEVLSTLKEEIVEEKCDKLLSDDMRNLFKEEYIPAVDFSMPKKGILEEKENTSNEFNLFENIEATDTYVTYYVYIVKEGDTIEKIIEKYNVTKESVAYYNKIDNIVPGTKLIIPAPTNE